MRIYSKYIIKNLVGPIAFVTLSLTGVVWLVQSLQNINFIVNQGLPAADFLSLIALLLPSVIGMILPVASLCATIFIFNRLIYDSEILVLSAAGLSRAKIAKPAILLFLLICGCGYAISLYLLPVSYSAFKNQQYEMRDNYAALMLEEGVFSSPLENITVYVGERTKEGGLSGILVHDNRNNLRPVTWMAKSGKIVKMGELGNSSVRFLLENASSQQIDRSTGEVKILYFDSYPFDISLYAGSKQGHFRKKDERFLPELFWPEAGVSNKDKNRFFAEGHERIIWPLYSLALPLLAISLMTWGDFNRRGQTNRILIVAAISVALIIGAIATKNIVARGNSIFIIMYLPLIASFATSFYFLFFNHKKTKEMQ